MIQELYKTENDKPARGDNISQVALEALRALYKPGTRVELILMNDPYSNSLKPGDRGTVTDVDDIGSVFVDWDNGSKLAVVYGPDKIKVLR